jgi:hypothetical protein
MMSTASPKRKRGQFSHNTTSDSGPQVPWPILKSDVLAVEDSRRSSVAGKLGDLSLHCDIPRKPSGDDIPEPKRRAVAPLSGVELPSFAQASSSAETVDCASQSHSAATGSESDVIRREPKGDGERPGSPTLSEEVNELYWSDKEITGYNPADPADDGYGINGIGFKPTPAIAYQRSQRRKHQLAEYRNREAREARQKRSERRLGASATSDRRKDETEPDPRRTKVHFDDG